MQPKICLIVEVDTAWHEILSRALEEIQSISVDVTTATSAERAFEAIRSRQFELMLLDLSLDPARRYKWGRDLLFRLKNRGIRIPPTIIVTGSTEFDDVLDIMNNFRDRVLYFAPKGGFSDFQARRQFGNAVLQAFDEGEKESFIAGSRDTEFVRASAFAGTENTTFSSEEIAHIAARLQDIEAHLRMTLDLSQDEASFVRSRLDFLSEMAKRQGRRDWFHAAIGVFFTIATGLSLAPAPARELFRLVGQLLRSMLGGDLLPP